jgi:hypothetical protein
MGMTSPRIVNYAGKLDNPAKFNRKHALPGAFSEGSLILDETIPISASFQLLGLTASVR